MSVSLNELHDRLLLNARRLYGLNSALLELGRGQGLRLDLESINRTNKY